MPLELIISKQKFIICKRSSVSYKVTEMKSHKWIQQTGTKGIQDIWLCWQMEYIQIRICPRKWDA